MERKNLILVWLKGQLIIVIRERQTDRQIEKLFLACDSEIFWVWEFLSGELLCSWSSGPPPFGD